MYPRGAGGAAAAAAAGGGGGGGGTTAATAGGAGGSALVPPSPPLGSNFVDLADCYDIKRQRVLHGGSEGGSVAATSSIYGSYYHPGSAKNTSPVNSNVNAYYSSAMYPPLPPSPSTLQSNLPVYSSGVASAPVNPSYNPFHREPSTPPPINPSGPPGVNSSYFPAGSPPPPLDRHLSPYVSDHSPSFDSTFFRGPRFPFYGQARPFPVVRLRGLPFNCTERDVYEFFAGLDVIDVLLTHKQGRFSGEAYCLFGLPVQVDYALQRNKCNIGQRYIEVFRSKKQDYYFAVAAEATENMRAAEGEPAASLPPPKASSDKEKLPHTGVLKLRGLPFSASKRDIVEFFKGYEVKDDSIHFVVHSDGRATGEAYIEFAGPVESKNAMSRDKMMLGSRYVELFPSTHEEAGRAATRPKN